MINKGPDNKENFDVMEQSCCMSLSVNSVSKLLSTFQSPSNCPLVKTLFVYVVRESKWQIYSFHAQINRPVPKVHPEHESHVTHRSHPPAPLSGVPHSLSLRDPLPLCVLGLSGLTRGRS